MNKYHVDPYQQAIIPFVYTNGRTGLTKSARNYLDSDKRSGGDHALNQMLNGESILIRYSVSGNARVMPWTRGHLLPADDLSSYGFRPVTMEIEDTHANFDGTAMTPVTDYEVASVTIGAATRYSYIQIDRYSNWYYNDRTDSSIPVTLWGYRDGQWVRYASYQDGTVTAENGATAAGGTVTLPSGVERVKEQSVSTADGMGLSYSVTLRIKPSDRLLDALNAKFAAEDYVMSTVDNYAEMAVFDSDGNRVLTNSDSARAWLHGRNYKVAARATKSFSMLENDRVAKRVKIRTTATLIQQSNILARDEYDDAVASGAIPHTTSGTWYDLLPRGVDPDLSSVRLSGGDTVRDVYSVENYRDSGRTLLVVVADMESHIGYTREDKNNPYYSDVTYPRSGFKNTQTLTFDAWNSWDAIYNFGLSNVYNVIAYEAAERDIGSAAGWMGEPDDPDYNNNKLSKNAVGVNLMEWMTDLDSRRNDPSFVYAGSNLNASEVDLSAITSLTKQVTVDGSGRWSSGQDGDAVVYEGGSYTYRVMVYSTDAPTRDIVIFDSLENYDYADGGARWHGVLTSVDVSQLRDLGAEPVVYYSTASGLSFERNAYGSKSEVRSFLSNSSIWSTTPPADPADITAIAVDAGADFELEEDKQIYFLLHMRAPLQGETTETLFAADPDKAQDQANNAHAYNSVALSSTQKNQEQGESYSFVAYDYTQVGILPCSVTVTKTWDDLDDNDGLRPDSVTVHLYANGEDTGKTLTLTAENEWQGGFEHLPMFDENGRRITYSAVEEPCDGYESTNSGRNDAIILRNTHVPERIDVPFSKTWEDNNDLAGDRPASINVRLIADGKFTGLTQTLRPDADGVWQGSFQNVLKYHDGEEIVYTVEETPVYKYITTYNGNEINNRYYPYGDLTVTKAVAQTTDVSEQQEFAFTLLLTAPDGTELTEKYDYRKSDGTVGRIGNGDTFTLRGGETITVTDIPSESAYQVVEDETSGFTVVTHSNDTGAIRAGETKTASFVNRYQANGVLQLEAHKTLTGRDMGRYQFRFQLQEDGSDQIYTASNQADGTAQFGVIRFTQADHGVEHTYTVTEVDRGIEGYTYDSHAITVKVTPMDNGDGTMTCPPPFLRRDGGGACRHRLREPLPFRRQR